MATVSRETECRWLGWSYSSSRTGWHAPCWHPHHLNRQSCHGSNQDISPHSHWGHPPGLDWPMSLPGSCRDWRTSPLSENQISESPEEEQDQEFIEDQEALKHQAQLRGLPYDSCLLREDTIDATIGNIFAVAPGEGHKPISILSDQHFEEMCNPTKISDWQVWSDHRKTNLTVCKVAETESSHCCQTLPVSS